MERVQIQIRKWREYQAKPDEKRRWTWIKVHTKLLTDYHFRELSVADKWNLIGLWCLADPTTGIVDMERGEVFFMLGCKSLTIENLDHFVTISEQNANKREQSVPKSEQNVNKREQNVPPDDGTDCSLEVYTKDATLESETEVDGSAKDGSSVATRRDGFIQFWELYPAGRKHDRTGNRIRFMRKTREGGATPDEIVDGLMLWIASHEWTKDSGQYVPLASTFLNQNRWESAPPDPDISQSSGRPEGATL